MTSDEYFEWIKKFERKHTTDECLTPPKVYDRVKNYVVEFFSLENCTIERPFYPNGNYKEAAEKYDAHTVVIDNPPFSKMAEIIKFYNDKHIRYFLFAHAKTALGLVKHGASVWFAPANIIFDNGARVSVSFITNMEACQCIRTVPQLLFLQKTQQKTNNNYPPDLFIFSHFETICRHGLEIKVPCDASMVRTEYNDPQAGRKKIYGAGIQLPTNKNKVL